MKQFLYWLPLDSLQCHEVPCPQQQSPREEIHAFVITHTMEVILLLVCLDSRVLIISET